MQDHYDQIEKQSGQVLYEEPEIPACVEHVWGWFLDLAAGESVSYTEIRSWVEMTENSPSPQEVDMLRSMCAARQEALNDRSG